MKRIVDIRELNEQAKVIDDLKYVPRRFTEHAAPQRQNHRVLSWGRLGVRKGDEQGHCWRLARGGASSSVTAGPEVLASCCRGSLFLSSV